jgi:DHA1 family multidrug resistance protein-like MFS transporter
MSDMIRDAPLGQLIRLVTKNKFLKYPEEVEGWECPHVYNNPDVNEKKIEAYEADVVTREAVATPTEPTITEGAPLEEVETAPKEEIEAPGHDSDSSSTVDEGQLGKIATQVDPDGPRMEKIRTVRTTVGLEKIGTRAGLAQSKTRADLEQAFTQASLAPQPSAPIIPARLEDGTILVDCKYGEGTSFVAALSSNIYYLSST